MAMADDDDQYQARLELFTKYVARPITPESFQDPNPALVADTMLIGNKYHAANVNQLLDLGVTAVLNCASGGISRLPVDLLQERGIRYAFTNVRQDSPSYPILHESGKCSTHLQVAKGLYAAVLQAGGKVLFFCVAGQNRSATLALAVLMLYGYDLEDLLKSCSRTRPFIMENEGFRQQLVELEAHLKNCSSTTVNDRTIYSYADCPSIRRQTTAERERESHLVEIELLIPGLCTMDVKIPVESTIAEVKQCLVDYANQHLLSFEDCTVAKSWVVLAMFGFDSMYDFPLETEAIELTVQLQLMQEMFGLKVMEGKQTVQWNGKCRFALVIFSVFRDIPGRTIQAPWTFCHEERPGAPATLLENTLMSTHLRAWDFVSGRAWASKQPIVFSFSNDPRDRRQFMKISTSSNEAQQFNEVGEGGILGMGQNAVVHRVELKPTSDGVRQIGPVEQEWDSAVKRPFGLSKMLHFLENKSEAGLAKRMRFANSLNSDGRVVYFYGLGVALSANAENTQEYKFEATLLARYEEHFSTYTMKRFMQDYTATTDPPPWQAGFSLIAVKVLLVSLLNAFRDLTLMGVQGFDFNHLNNVLVSRDHQTVMLLDIDGNSKGSIQFPSEYIGGTSSMTPGLSRQASVHKPSLDVDLNAVLPTVVQQLLLGKGRGTTFVTNKKSEIWKQPPHVAKETIREVLREDFFPGNNPNQKHLSKVVEWFYAMLKKQAPWGNWTHDIYDAMRCIDHLPIT